MIVKKPFQLPKQPKPLIMGIVNASPDSFYGPAKHNRVESAMEYVSSLIKHGVDMIDVGGEAAKTQQTELSAQDEINRVVPIIKAIRSLTTLPISIDSYKPEVVQAAIEAGADIINDVSGLINFELANIAASTGALIVIMHTPHHPLQATCHAEQDIVQTVQAFWQNRIERLISAGVRTEQIVLDMGIGFGKTDQDNIELIHSIAQFKTLGYPMLLGCSRIKFLDSLANTSHAEQRLPATMVVNMIAIKQGIDIIRVHDVAEFVKVRSALLRLT